MSGGSPVYWPGPNFVCDFSGFKTKIEDGVLNWDGSFVRKGFEDVRNPQDFLRAVPDRSALPIARPETPDQFIDPMNPVTPGDL